MLNSGLDSALQASPCSDNPSPVPGGVWRGYIIITRANPSPLKERRGTSPSVNLYFFGIDRSVPGTSMPFCRTARRRGTLQTLLRYRAKLIIFCCRSVDARRLHSVAVLRGVDSPLAKGSSAVVCGSAMNLSRFEIFRGWGLLCGHTEAASVVNSMPEEANRSVKPWPRAAVHRLIRFVESIVAQCFWHNRLMLRGRLVFDGRIFDATK